MKNRIKIFSVFSVVIALLLWLIPILVGKARVKPLEGSFLVGNCACNHDIFYLIEAGQAYDYCPGHKEKKLIGATTQTSQQVTVYRENNNEPAFQLKLEDNTYYLRFPSLEGSVWTQVEQISNPWRTSLRSYFPE